MSKERLEEILDLYKKHQTDEDLIEMIAELRDEFLNYKVVNKKHSYDISPELACGPEHVLYYLAEYIDILEQQNKRYREALEYLKDYAETSVNAKEQENPETVKLVTKQALEGESN